MTWGMIWFVLGAIVVVLSVFLIGKASHDLSEQNHKHEMECIQAGGHMTLITSSNGLVCIK